MHSDFTTKKGALDVAAVCYYSAVQGSALCRGVRRVRIKGLMHQVISCRGGGEARTVNGVRRAADGDRPREG